MRPLPPRQGKLLLTVLAAISVAALLIATLWPLNPNPRNEVSWLNGDDGVQFGDYGTIFSAGEFPRQRGGENEPFSLEFWMEPGLTWDSNVMVAFYTPEDPQQFLLRQNGSDVVVAHAAGESERKSLFADDAVHQGRKTLVTVTAGTDGTALYVNGEVKRSSRNLVLSRSDLSGELVVGNSPVGNNSWSGILRAVAIYKRKLSAEEVASHYGVWLANREDEVLDKAAMLALYRFRERSGSTVRNEIRPGIDLYIPNHYKIWRPYFMEPPWKEFQASRAYAMDVIINVAGFVPLGLVLFPYFQIARKSRRPWLMSYLFGALLSLTIEVLQYLIPTRFSGWTDVITNSTGAALGASVYLSAAVQKVLRKIFGEKEAQRVD